MDFISQLPETILHNILNRLSAKEAARTCILSKAWNLVESRSPFMFFHKSDFPSHEYMLRFAEKRVKRFSENDLTIVTFSFCFSLGSSYDHRVDSLLKSVIYNAQTQLLNLEIKNYSLPHFVLQSETLIMLSLCGCKCDARAEIRLPKLEELHLINADVDNHFVEQLTHGCPSLLRLNIKGCTKLTSLAVTCLHRIQRVDVIECCSLCNVEILSLDLLYVKFLGFLRSKLCDFNFCSLKKLILRSVTVKSSLLQHVASTCKKLTLDKVDCENSINISSQNLIKLSIFNCKNMKNAARIYCPNLQSLVYVNNPLPFWSPCEFTLLTDVRIEFYKEHLHSVWYNQLKDMFAKISSIKGSIKQIVHCKCHADLIILDGFEELMIPEVSDIKDLKLKEKVIVSTILNSRQLDKLLDHICNNFMCLQRNVYIASTNCSNSNFSQVLFDKLSKFGAETNCCRNARVKCWRHHLLSVNKDSTTNTIPALLGSQQFDQCQITTIMLEFVSEVINLD